MQQSFNNNLYHSHLLPVDGRMTMFNYSCTIFHVVCLNPGCAVETYAQNGRWHLKSLEEGNNSYGKHLAPLKLLFQYL